MFVHRSPSVTTEHSLPDISLTISKRIVVALKIVMVGNLRPSANEVHSHLQTQIRVLAVHGTVSTEKAVSPERIEDVVLSVTDSLNGSYSGGSLGRPCWLSSY
ncbi:hypothetical protein GCM10028857_03030 [Salinarchaeum chitinilyticum]